MSVAARLEYALNVGLVGTPALRLQRWRDERRLAARRPRPDDLLAPPLASTAWMKELMSRHYLAGRYANGVRKVAWVTSGAPLEILRALDFHIVYPENHAALCGARRVTESLASEAEARGYARDLCSYARSDIGSAITGRTPVGRLPKPDLLVCCTNICQTVLYWYRVLAEHFQVPLYVVDTPFLYEDAKPHQVAYVKRQLEGLVPVAERVAGRALAPSRLEEIVLLSKEASELWLRILDVNRNRPAPMTAFDGFIVMAPIVDLRGEQVTVDFYRRLLAELEDRVARGVGAVRDERVRLLWDNLPIWPRLSRLSKFLAARGANLVASTYTYAWGELAPLMQGTDVLETVANVYLHPILNRSAGYKLGALARMTRDFAADGVILHSDRSCKPYSLGQMGQRERLMSASDVPALLLEADHADPRAFSDEQLEGRIEAFLETVTARA